MCSIIGYYGNEIAIRNNSQRAKKGCIWLLDRNSWNKWVNKYPISETIPIQLLSYYTVIEKEYDPDYPRNLLKLITVK